MCNEMPATKECLCSKSNSSQSCTTAWGQNMLERRYGIFDDRHRITKNNLWLSWKSHWLHGLTLLCACQVGSGQALYTTGR